MSYYLTINSFQLDPRYIDAPRIDLGDGVDLEDPLNPHKSTYSPFQPGEKTAPAEEPAAGAARSRDIINETIVFKESLSEREEGDVLKQYFKASYGLSSISQSYEAAKKTRKSHQAIYALLEHGGEAAVLKSDDMSWHRDVESDMVGDLAIDKLLFVSRYGSHFVSAIKYGLLIGIQAKIDNKKIEISSTLSVDFKAAYGAFSAGGGASKQNEENLSNMGVEILLEATSGGRTDGGMVTARGLDGVRKLLDDIGAGNVKFMVAPIQVTLKPYWPTLPQDWKKTRAVLMPSEQEYVVPAANYGVPKGTIIAWCPTGEYLRGLESESEEVTIMAPDGWAICDGSEGTPDLKDRFIRGVSEFGEVCDNGGSLNHQHNGTADAIDREINSDLWRNAKHEEKYDPLAVTHINHQHNLTVLAANNIPPFVNLVYIMKL